MIGSKGADPDTSEWKQSCFNRCEAERLKQCRHVHKRFKIGRIFYGKMRHVGWLLSSC
jgi:hypothetical protein